MKWQNFEYAPAKAPKWVPLTQPIGNSGEGWDPYTFADLPQGQTAVKDAEGQFGYWNTPADLPADWIHADASPFPTLKDPINGLSLGTDSYTGALFSLPKSYSSLDEMLQNPMWWGAQDLRPEVAAQVVADPRATYASLLNLYAKAPGSDFPGVMPAGYTNVTGRLNRENIWPIIGAEGGYRSMQDLGWEPGYGIVARQGSFIPEQNEDWQKLAVGLLVSGAMGGAMAGAFAPAGTAGAAMPAAGKAAWGLAQAAYNKNPLSALGALGNAGSAAGLWSPQAGGWFNTGVGALSSLNSAAGDPLGLRGGSGRAGSAGSAGSAAPLTQLAQQPAATPTEQALRQQTLNVPSLALRPGLI